MAFLTATAKVETQVKLKRMFGNFENRFSNHGIIKAYFDNANLLADVDQLSRMKNQSPGQEIGFPIFVKQDLAVLTARSCTVSGAEPTTTKPTFTTITRGFEVKFFPIVYANNDFALADGIAQQWMNGMRSVLGNLDTFAAARLESGKSTSLAAVDLPGITANAGDYEIDFEHADELYEMIPTILEKNDMGAYNYNNLANSESRKRMLDYEKHGLENDVNRAAVLRGDLPSAVGPFTHYTSNRLLVDDNTFQEVHFLVPRGGIGVFTYNHWDAVRGWEGGDNQKMYLEKDQVFGITWDVREQDICADIRATYGDYPGYESAAGYKLQIAANFVFMEAFSSDSTKANLKINVKKAA